MQYCIVEFIDTKEVEVVPCTWVQGDTCQWPNRPSNKVQLMIKKGCSPGLNCTEYQAKVKGIFASYHEARLKLPLSEYTSDINSDRDVPGRRKRRAVIVDSDEDFPEVPASFAASVQGSFSCPLLGRAESSHKTPSRMQAHKPTDAAASTSSSTSLSAVLGRTAGVCAQASRLTGDSLSPHSVRLVEQDELCLSSPGSDPDTDIRETPPPSHRETHAATLPLPPHPPHHENHAATLPLAHTATSREALESAGHSRSEKSAEENCMSQHDFQRQVLRMLNIVRFNQQQQADLLSSLLPPRPTVLDPEQPLVVPEPFDSLQELEEFESTLTPDKEKQLVAELTRFGGSSCKMAVKRMLYHLLTDNLGMMYSWLGNKGKEAIKHLKIVGIILRAVQRIKKLEKTTDYEVEVEVKSWLRHAKARHSRVPQRNRQAPEPKGHRQIV